MNFGLLATKLDMLVWTQPNQRFWGDYSSVHTAHDIVRQRWMPWRTMSDNIGRHRTTQRHRTMSSGVVRQLLHVNCHVVRVLYDIVPHCTTSCDNWRRNWTKFNCRCGNVRHRAVCEHRRLINVCDYSDIGRHHTTSPDVVRSVNTAYISALRDPSLSNLYAR